MIKLVKVPEWVYMNCIYDKKIGSKLTEILKNIDEWESSGKIRYQFDIDANMDILNKNNLINLPQASLSEDINNSKEIEQPIFPTKIDSIDYIMNMMINHDIINDIMFLINHILRNIKDPLTGVRNPKISKCYINHDDNLYFSSPNRFGFGEDVICAFFHTTIYRFVSDGIAAKDEYISISLKINDVIISQHDDATNPNNRFEILDKMIN